MFRRAHANPAVSTSLLSQERLFAQNVQPKAGTPGVVQEAPAAPSGAAPASSPLGSMMPILMMLVFLVPLFLVMSRKQKREEKARATLKRGDRVMTNAGLIGELVEMDERIAKVKISPGVTVNIVANTVSPFTETEKAPPKELKEAKTVSEKK